MDENMKFLQKGKAESRHLQNCEEFIGFLLDLIEGKRSTEGKCHQRIPY